MNIGTKTITVTAGHIARGLPGESCQCPIALAAREVAPGAEFIAVGTDEITFETGFDQVEVLLPLEARSFVARFDSGRPVTPFSFEVEVPQ